MIHSGDQITSNKSFTSFLQSRRQSR